MSSSSSSSSVPTSDSSTPLPSTTSTTSGSTTDGGLTSSPTRPLFPERTRPPAPSAPPPGGSYPASLYLFVFLATLLLLLALSVAILVRSFVLRRRFRRRVEEALAAGLLAGHPGGSASARARWRNMVRPKLHDVAVARDDKAARWDDFQPLNATLIPASPSSEKQQTQAQAAVPDTPPASSPALARIFGESRFPHSLAALRRRQEHQNQHQQPAHEDADDEDAPRLAEPQLQLSVLLAMPARRGEPAELALGVARESVPEGWRPPDPQEKTIS